MVSFAEWRWERKERARARWEDRHFPLRRPRDETEQRVDRRRVRVALREWGVISEDEPPEQRHAPAEVEAPRAELGGYHGWLARTIAAAADEDYRTLVASFPRDTGREESPKTGEER
jgi:hypothetical protein